MRVLEKKKLYHNAWGSKTEVMLFVERYHNGRVALQLVCPMEEGDGLESYMTCSVNMILESCPDNEVWIKDWSENEGIAEWLFEIGVIEEEPTGSCISGYTSVERYRFTAAFMVEMGDALAREKKE